MHIQYALYERMPKGGFQWTWHAEGLRNSLLGDFQYRIQMPTDPDRIHPDQLCGGILKFAHGQAAKIDEHVVVYRFYNGGSDEGRSLMTMLTAWIPVDQLSTSSEAQGILALFDCPIFKYVSEKARTVGIERPYSLIENVPLPAATEPASAELAEFLDGLSDEDYDYSLTIHNGTHAVQKTPSVVFKLREAEAPTRQAENERHQTHKMRHAETAVRSSGLQNRRPTRPRNAECREERKHQHKWLPILGLVGIVATSASFCWLSELNRLRNSPEVFHPPLKDNVTATLAKEPAATKVASPSPVQDNPPGESQDIVTALKHLPPNVQERLLTNLRTILGARPRVSPIETTRKRSPMTFARVPGQDGNAKVIEVTLVPRDVA
ncbi:MAG: hypothetical protein KF777_25035 [Planctomycetaceae bacterium]|nr:hypothetical protein [Planctomycetaceae bacterium]